MTTLSEEGIRRARASIAEWSREAVEQQVLADCLREHADEHQARVYAAESQVCSLRQLLAKQGIADEEPGT